MALVCKACFPNHCARAAPTRYRVTYTIDFEPIGIRLLCEDPLTVSAAARQAGLSLRTVCGGKGIQAERSLLSEEQLADGWRLACRTTVSADVSVYVPATSLTESQVIQLAGRASHVESCPVVDVLPVTTASPSLADPAADLGRVADALRREHDVGAARVDLPALRSLCKALREGEWRVSVALRGDEIVAAYPGSLPRALGLAVDVGTTKLACYLVDLETGQTIAAKGVMNPQIAYGEDVMSRLEATMVAQENAAQMQQAVIEAINATANELCASQGLATEYILDVCMVGNTAMHHLMLNLPVRPLALSPFVPALSAPLDARAWQIGLSTAPGAHVYLPPPIAGFVGSDHLAFLLAAGFGQDDRTRLGIDIGTNTEIAVQAGGQIVSCSTASGPAFEGAHIRHGMRAAPGAVERVCIAEDGRVDCDVIGDRPAAGICGSGILDALAEMRRVGIINERGRITKGMPGVRCGDNELPTFLLTNRSDARRDITISQEDIDQVLLAKGAIRAGIEILMDYLGVTGPDIDELLIAGAFGTYLDPVKATCIGLLPDVPLARVHAVGNAAGDGARMMLASTHVRRRAADLARRIGYLELAIYPGFNKYLVRGVRLPPL
jgi:uncharacterized 2Fe-2S/4Fe-4S cluster protein (DUF4445 family)